MCRLGDERSVRVLLELGANPNAGSTALWGLEPSCEAGSSSQIAELLLQHGADCLAPLSGPYSDSVLANFAMHRKGVAAILLALLERQRAAGQLELGSPVRTAQLFLGAMRMGHQQLLSHSLRWLEAHFCAVVCSSMWHGAAEEVLLVPQAEAAILKTVFDDAVRDTSRSCPASLRQLLASSLPIDLGELDFAGR